MNQPRGTQRYLPTHACHVWSYDFVSVRTHDGKSARLLNLIDEYTRECLLIHAERRGPMGAQFIAGLSNAVGHVVIDKTGLTGYYDIDLKWTPDEDLAAGVSGPTLFTALEEQMGLKLISEKTPVAVLVVDHIERPSAN